MPSMMGGMPPMGSMLGGGMQMPSLGMDDMMGNMNMGGMNMGSSSMQSSSFSSSSSSSSSTSMMSSDFGGMGMPSLGMGMPPMRGMEMPGFPSMPGMSIEEMSSMPPTASPTPQKEAYTVTSPPMSPPMSPPPPEMNHKVGATADFSSNGPSQTAEATVLLKVRD